MNRIGDNLVHFGANKILVQALIHAHVKFILVGGLAVAWHCSERKADDMDLLVEPASDNSARITDALSRLNITGFAEDAFSRSALQVPLKQTFYAELLTPQPGGLSYAEIEATAVMATLFNMPILCASIEALLSMKRRAVQSAEHQRMKHEADIVLLERSGGA